MPAGGGRPPAPRKQMQMQEEMVGPFDDRERDAEPRRYTQQHGAGRFATARAGAARGSRGAAPHAGGPHTDDGSSTTTGSSETHNSTFSGQSSRGYAKGCAGYSAPSGYLSPTRQRVQALTARKEQEDAMRRMWAAQQKEKARKAAQRAGALAAAQTAREEERRAAAKRELELKQRDAEERAYRATQSARVKGLPPVNLAKAMRPPPTGRQRAAKKRAQRPEWGAGHAGGRVMRKDAQLWGPERGGSRAASPVRV